MSTTYWLDRDDRITRVSSSWDSFALENDGGLRLERRCLRTPF